MGDERTTTMGPLEKQAGRDGPSADILADKPGRYRFGLMEERWQRYWEQHQTFRCLNPGELGFDASRPKFYVLDMFPYPSGAGLHVGHPLGYCATDILARYKRMRGFNVLHPMGFDAFGLPAEQYAVQTNVHPAITTKENITMYRRQLKMFGFSYDWSREISTSESSYYKWTQWMFTRMFESWYDRECRWTDVQGRQVVGRARPIRELIEELEAGRWAVDENLRLLPSKAAWVRASGPVQVKGECTSPPAVNPGPPKSWSQLSEPERRKVLDSQRLAFLDQVPVNWCPALGTVLSNEEVDNEGRSERGGHPVYRRPLKQWMLRITCYAERLLSGLEDLDWPEPIKLMQRNWIGRSEGAEVLFPLSATAVSAVAPDHCSQSSGTRNQSSEAVRVYTTRPDTLFGATYMVLAPEHAWVRQITTAEQRADVESYVAAATRMSDLARTAEAKEKTGVFTGAYAINPVTGWEIPIWVADYVLMGYGTGAIMAVPGSDTRDFEFASKFGLPIVAVVRPTPAWIEQRIVELTKDLTATADKELRRVAESFPELAERIALHRDQSKGLGEMTQEVLRKRVGVDRMVEHYVRHPASWGAAFVEEGMAVNSPRVDIERCATGVSADHCSQSSGTPEVCDLNGLPTAEAKEKMIRWLEERGVGRRTVNYKLRDWLFSRQRYWGEPFPVLHGEQGETIALHDDELPLELPPMADFKPTASADDAHSLPAPPLARAKEWTTITRDGRCYRRDLNTMPNWAGSCWYYLRFMDPGNSARFCAPQAERYWMPVDLYVGGAEHAVLHLLYARFWHKVLYDLSYLTTAEPFQKLFNQGMIQSFAFRGSGGLVVGPDKVDEHGDEQFVLKETGEPVTRIVAKMSKALKNVVNPDAVIAEYGADTFRLYEMYMGPLDAAKPWNTRDVPGLHKLCQRIWRLVVDEETGGLSASLTDDEPDTESLRTLHKLIGRVSEELEAMKFNTAIAAIFDFVNAMTPRQRRPRAVIESFVLVLAPFTPHLAEELWNRLGHERSLAYEPWPEFDLALARDATVEVGVQVNGKLRARLTLDADSDEKAIETAALADERVVEAVKDKTVRKVIVVKGRLVNIVAT